MNLFITGATGFVGSNLLNNKNFIKKFKKIYCLTRRKKVSNLKKIIWIKGNLSSNLKKYFRYSDCILHLAAHSANKPYDNLVNCIKWNCLISTKLINDAFKSGVKKFVIVGSYHEYGYAGQILKKKKVSPNNFCLPLSTYALSKSFFFQTLFSWSLGKDISIKYLRLPHVYGVGELKSRLWPQIQSTKVKKIVLGNPEYKTNFLNIKKLTKKFNYLIDIKKFKRKTFEIINVTDKEMSLHNFVVSEKKRLNSKTKILKTKKRKNLLKFLLPKNENIRIKIK
tara:strand:- start:2 stop:844 length:843 start_codon:yes stop_codon:yes gene_type:complete